MKGPRLRVGPDTVIVASSSALCGSAKLRPHHREPLYLSRALFALSDASALTGLVLCRLRALMLVGRYTLN
jgi:hypothetical protein